MDDFALVIGGGGAKGICGIGILKVLERNKIKPDYIVGTSIGSLLGSILAYGYDTEYMEEIFNEHIGKKFFKLLDLNIISKSLFKGNKIEEKFEQFFMNANIEELPTKFESVATDIKDGSEYVFDSGNLTKAVRASISLPGIFEPVNVDNKYYMDGGVSNPVPMSCAINKGYKKIVAINFLNRLEEYHNDIIKTVSASAIHFQRNLFKHQLKEAKKHADIFLIEPDTTDTEILDFFNLEDEISNGKKYMVSKIDKLKDFLNA
ncbi:MAG: patatin-like phospholipase family protein [Candidatus Woesearchaeota archaeon]